MSAPLQQSAFNLQTASNYTVKEIRMTSGYFVTPSDANRILNIFPVSGFQTVTLPPSLSFGLGKSLWVWFSTSATSTFTFFVAVSTPDKFDGALSSSYVLNWGAGIELLAVAGGWQIVSKKGNRYYSENPALGAARSTGYDSVAIGGTADASGSTSVALGSSASSSGSNTLALSYAASASGTYASAIGQLAVASGQTSFALNAGRALTDGKLAYSSGVYISYGDNLYGLYVLRGATTSATPKALTCDLGGAGAGLTNQLILPNSSAFTFTINVVARQKASEGTASAAWTITGLIRREATAASTVLVTSTTTVISNVPAWSIAVSADTTNGGLAVTVTGAAATNIYWVASAQTSEVIYA
jgi:hypothetical protein